MGATVSTGKQAFAFTATDSGETIYVLHEQTYEKNVFPHTPRWSCVSIGPIATVLRRIFGMAANCVSGDLQVRGGRSAPEQYIADWLKQLACPLQQEDQPIQLRIAKGWDQSIPADDAPKVLAHLVANGRGELAQDLEAGLCFLSTLHAESKLVACIYGDGPLSPWRIITSMRAGDPRPDLGYSPALQAPAATSRIPAFLKVDGDTRLVQQDDGSWRSGGWEYQILGQFVESLWATELTHPGSYTRSIRRFREAIQSAPMVPPGTKVIVDLSVKLDSVYQRQCCEEIGNHLPAKRTGSTLEVDLPSQASELWRLTRLPRECATWLPGTFKPVLQVQGDLLAV
jgi:hypothetical protein